MALQKKYTTKIPVIAEEILFGRDKNDASKNFTLKDIANKIQEYLFGDLGDGIANKADKPDSPVEDNIMTSDSSGNLKDSLKSFDENGTISDDYNKVPTSKDVSDGLAGKAELSGDTFTGLVNINGGIRINQSHEFTIDGNLPIDDAFIVVDPDTGYPYYKDVSDFGLLSANNEWISSQFFREGINLNDESPFEIFNSVPTNDSFMKIAGTTGYPSFVNLDNFVTKDGFNVLDSGSTLMINGALSIDETIFDIGGETIPNKIIGTNANGKLDYFNETTLPISTATQNALNEKANLSDYNEFNGTNLFDSSVEFSDLSSVIVDGTINYTSASVISIGSTQGNDELFGINSSGNPELIDKTYFATKNDSISKQSRYWMEYQELTLDSYAVSALDSLIDVWVDDNTSLGTFQLNTISASSLTIWVGSGTPLLSTFVLTGTGIKKFSQTTNGYTINIVVDMAKLPSSEVDTVVNILPRADSIFNYITIA